MSYLIGFHDPDGNGGYMVIEAKDELDACREFRFLINGGATWRIDQVIDVAAMEAL